MKKEIIMDEKIEKSFVSQLKTLSYSLNDFTKSSFSSRLRLLEKEKEIIEMKNFVEKYCDEKVKEVFSRIQPFSKRQRNIIFNLEYFPFLLSSMNRLNMLENLADYFIEIKSAVDNVISYYEVKHM
ncbi:MAG: hypothetical protein JXR63_02600 [Spirochaetales bacterium]|nr:hypothetical protein [Spirochaetales bacterium]